MVGCLPNMHKVPGFIPSSKERAEEEREEKEGERKNRRTQGWVERIKFVQQKNKQDISLNKVLGA